MKKNRNDFTMFLGSLNLESYSKQYANVRIVEMDLLLPKKVFSQFNVTKWSALPLEDLYKIYWDTRDFIEFDEFYKIYLSKKRMKILNEFSSCYGFETTAEKKTFYKGLKARIYRTWVSILTQIHAGYTAEFVFGAGTVEMSSELDIQNIDILVNYHGGFGYQVKKKNHMGVKSSRNKGKKLNIPVIELVYDVPDKKIFDSPRKKNGDYRLPYKRFLENELLSRLDNGFIIFKENIFENKKNEIDQV